MTWRYVPIKEMERLHPQSWRELRQLVVLHGAKAVMRAVQHIEEEHSELAQGWMRTWQRSDV
jgi:hypothetical protein